MAGTTTMREAIRDWIAKTHQPWRKSPQESTYRCPVGASGSMPVKPDTVRYFERKGITVQGRLIEDLIEAELLGIFEVVASWLPAGDQRTLAERAHSASRTRASPTLAPCIAWTATPSCSI